MFIIYVEMKKQKNAFLFVSAAKSACEILESYNRQRINNAAELQ